MSFYYVYVLRSLKDNMFYTGYTINLKNRLKSHNDGKVNSTHLRIPFELIYFEASLNQKDALHREKYLKTSYGKKYIKNRIKHFL